MALAMVFIPDSPTYLVKKQNIEGAKKSIRWLRGPKYTGVEEDISHLQKANDEARDPRLRTSLKDLFAKRIYLHPFFISLSLMFFRQFCGINQVTFYLQEIFIKAGSDLDAGLNAFIVSLVQVGIPICGRFYFRFCCYALIITHQN